MKAKIITGAIGALLSTMAAAQAPDAPADAAQTEPAAPSPIVEAGKIIIFRPSAIIGYAVACPVRYHGAEIVELGRGKFAEWSVPAGSYILANKTASVQVVVAPGDTQYVRCTIKPGFMTGRADLQIVDKETFAEHQADYGRKEIAAVSVAGGDVKKTEITR